MIRLRHLLAGACAASALMACATAPSAQTAPEVTAPAGSVRGETIGDIATFKGIPYAAPPVGEMRWRPPAPPARWDS
ncbi:carboxylesterase family protein, partial [Brevundimonas sp.]